MPNTNNEFSNDVLQIEEIDKTIVVNPEEIKATPDPLGDFADRMERLWNGGTLAEE